MSPLHPSQAQAMDARFEVVSRTGVVIKFPFAGFFRLDCSAKFSEFPILRDISCVVDTYVGNADKFHPPPFREQSKHVPFQRYFPRLEEPRITTKRGISSFDAPTSYHDTARASGTPSLRTEWTDPPRPFASRFSYPSKSRGLQTARMHVDEGGRITCAIHFEIEMTAIDVHTYASLADNCRQSCIQES